jgi:AraC-like DNA-binding protein
MARWVELSLDEPPSEVYAAVGLHGSRGTDEVFRLPHLWQLHLYGYPGTLTFDGVAHPIRPGHLSLVPPDTRVAFHYGAAHCEHLYAHFRLSPVGTRHRVPVMRDAGPEAPRLAETLRRTMASNTQPAPRATAELWALLWRVAELTGAADDRPQHPALRAAIAHAEEHLATPLTVPEIARAAGVSPAHLTRLFRDGTGRTVVGYLRHRRMERARHLLVATTLSIPAIAAAVGIPDLQAFNKSCRKELGASPRALRAGQADSRPPQPGL